MYTKNSITISKDTFDRIQSKVTILGTYINACTGIDIINDSLINNRTTIEVYIEPIAVGKILYNGKNSIMSNRIIDIIYVK